MKTEKEKRDYYLKWKNRKQKAIPALKEDKTYTESIDNYNKRLEAVKSYIRLWASTTNNIPGNLFMNVNDAIAYRKEAKYYIELENRMNNTDPRDYSLRNALSYKMRCIEERFNTLLGSYYKAKLLNIATI